MVVSGYVELMRGTLPSVIGNRQSQQMSDNGFKKCPVQAAD
ncbi:hypothetical protein VCR20J5_220154 [Vibrio crassostreae]|nr:hypothetical protein VCR20J5_220154 [Vibrio crassostreae]